MNWIQTGTALFALVGTVTVGVTQLATKDEVREVEEVVAMNQAEIQSMKVQDQILTHTKIIIMLKEKCDAGQCNETEKNCLEESKIKLKELKDK